MHELSPGVIWDDAAQERYEALVDAILSRKLSPGDKAPPRYFAEREARWAVELELHRRWVKARVQEALKTLNPSSKRALVDGWVAKYGKRRVGELVAILRDPKVARHVVESW